MKELKMQIKTEKEAKFAQKLLHDQNGKDLPLESDEDWKEYLLWKVGKRAEIRFHEAKVQDSEEMKEVQLLNIYKVI